MTLYKGRVGSGDDATAAVTKERLELTSILGSLTAETANILRQLQVFVILITCYHVHKL